MVCKRFGIQQAHIDLHTVLLHTNLVIENRSEPASGCSSSTKFDCQTFSFHQAQKVLAVTFALVVVAVSASVALTVALALEVAFELEPLP